MKILTYLATVLIDGEMRVKLNLLRRAVMIFPRISGPHLSPGVSLIFDLVHDSGILQSELLGVRICFYPNCQIRVFGDMANFSSEIG